MKLENGWFCPDRCLLWFTAEWCQPCKTIAPVLGAVASEHGLPLVVLDIADRGDVAQAFGVRSVPTVVGVRDGAVCGAVVGAQGQAAYATLCRDVAG
jgi:thioredoxin-like negative regulator of GroEL